MNPRSGTIILFNLISSYLHPFTYTSLSKTLNRKFTKRKKTLHLFHQCRLSPIKTPFSCIMSSEDISMSFFHLLNPTMLHSITSTRISSQSGPTNQKGGPSKWPPPRLLIIHLLTKVSNNPTKSIIWYVYSILCYNVNSFTKISLIVILNSAYYSLHTYNPLLPLYFFSPFQSHRSFLRTSTQDSP